LDKDIIVINDGSTDKTSQIIRKIKGIKALNHPRNQGKGAAIKTGLKSITGDVIIIQDADLELDPNDIYKLLLPITKNSAKVVYGSRFLINPHFNWLSHLANFAVTQTANLLYGAKLTDMATAYKMFTRDVADSIDLKCQRFEFCPEFTAKVLKRGYRIVEVPIHFYPRTKKEGKKVGWKDGFQALWTLLKYRFAD